MRYFEAPQEYTTERKSIFLAGGITGCPDWQQEVTQALEDLDVAFLNPRRKSFPIDDPTAAEGQIKWEFGHLRKATAILFWFPKDTLCPIVLYELGAWSMTNKPIFVGVEPGYQREPDVVIQTGLVRPTIQVVHSLSALCTQIRGWVALESYVG